MGRGLRAAPADADALRARYGDPSLADALGGASGLQTVLAAASKCGGEGGASAEAAAAWLRIAATVDDTWHTAVEDVEAGRRLVSSLGLDTTMDELLGDLLGRDSDDDGGTRVTSAGTASARAESRRRR